MSDPFSEFRTSQPSLFDAVTGPDNRSLTLTAMDVPRFYPIACAVIEIAHRLGWHVTVHHEHPGTNIDSLTVTPSR